MELVRIRAVGAGLSPARLRSTVADAGGRKGRPYGTNASGAQREEGAAGTETVEAGTISIFV